jgi:hypothetical protein
MTSHPYLRAYLAGIALPNAFLLVAFMAFLTAQRSGALPFALERLLVFPMAVVPNLWGAWNILYVALRRGGHRWPIGLHGALLPFLLMPAGILLTRAVLGIDVFTTGRVAVVFPIALTLYYLVWKHVVGFLNRVVGVLT